MINKKILIVVILIIVLFGAYRGYVLIKERSKCSSFYPENCNVFCSVDSDCKESSNCGCININENMSNSISTWRGQVVQSYSCIVTVCKCIDNKCQTYLPECKKEGETMSPGREDFCCDDLKHIEICYFIDPEGNCHDTNCTYSGCINCGDGICKDYIMNEFGAPLENKCNCPEDCH